MMSIPHVVNGHDEAMLIIFSVGILWIFLKCWHLSHFWTRGYASFCIVGQKYPALTTLFTNDPGPEWFPQIPSWISLSA